jgi:hypothetical protein
LETFICKTIEDARYRKLKVNQSSVSPASHYVLLIARWCVVSWNRQQHQANELRRRSYWSFQGWRIWNTTNCIGKPENKQKKQNYTLHKIMCITGKMESHFQNILTTITYSFCDDMTYSIQWSLIHCGGCRCVGQNHLMDTSYSTNIIMWMWTLVKPSALKYIFQHQALLNAASFLGDWVTAIFICTYLNILTFGKFLSRILDSSQLFQKNHTISSLLSP